ncbi:hypothetical protein GOX2584 (plasmid) [Gluconobacter oxydans 621H]|uniref:Abasic site processing protein n=3 Tax=Gluconobacter oxydans TaxID=442 RepID=Q5HXV5_GLUOX|nr:hypothetical protein GOX2584 [Gluconobacter oxydans 621H]
MLPAQVRNRDTALSLADHTHDLGVSKAITLHQNLLNSYAEKILIQNSLFLWGDYRWLGVPHRCVVPFTAFSEQARQDDGSFHPVWFAADERKPLRFFAGIWTSWTSVRKLKEGEVTADLFGFLTTDANAVVAPYHPKAMPVILERQEEIETWLTAPIPVALQLQKPLQEASLQVL